jgi:hypothetical protein|mmetsp:Transcript_16714/g.27026  ORF Transcript_16714/g.27026 Transcript_16714/m.27026 type:complete len:247 (+) Transcript_16714:53-793(+)
MVQILDTILEGDVSDDNRCSTECNLASACEAYSVFQSTPVGKKIDHLVFDYRSEKELELCEPECELDPVSANALVFGSDTEKAKDMLPSVVKEVQSKKGRKNRHKSLIDKALRLQQRQECKQELQDTRKQEEPVYIGFSDLAADWSHYTIEPLLESILDSVFTQVTSTQPTIGQPPAPVQITAPKQHRKKSLIDKAAAQQRKEFSAQHKQFEFQEMNAPKRQIQAYCTVCEGRPNKIPCALCSFRS